MTPLARGRAGGPEARATPVATAHLAADRYRLFMRFDGSPDPRRPARSAIDTARDFTR